MNKSTIFLVCSCFLFHVATGCKIDGCESVDVITKKPKHIVLESPLVSILDKLMPASAYGLMLQVRREVRKRLYGVKNKEGKLAGKYDYHGNKYTLLELVDIECQHERDNLEKKNRLIESKLSLSQEEFEKSLNQLEKEYAGMCTELRELLELAKEDFLSISACYAESARSTKKEILGIMQESCDKRGSQGCILLKWGEEDETNEGISLRTEVVTFKGFTEFCFDLCNFLEDLARNCPRTKKKFYDMVRRQQKANAK